VIREEDEEEEPTFSFDTKNEIGSRPKAASVQTAVWANASRAGKTRIPVNLRRVVLLFLGLPLGMVFKSPVVISEGRVTY